MIIKRGRTTSPTFPRRALATTRARGALRAESAVAPPVFPRHFQINLVTTAGYEVARVPAVRLIRRPARLRDLRAVPGRVPHDRRDRSPLSACGCSGHCRRLIARLSLRLSTRFADEPILG